MVLTLYEAADALKLKRGTLLQRLRRNPKRAKEAGFIMNKFGRWEISERALERIQTKEGGF